MKSVDDVLLETHGEKDFNYISVRRSMFEYRRLTIEELKPFIFRGKKELEIFDCLDRLPQTTGEIADKLNMPSKNVSSQLKRMLLTGLIECTNNGRLMSWRKRI